ncbi:MAG: hypothetical protein ABII27_07520 [bacterium]
MFLKKIISLIILLIFFIQNELHAYKQIAPLGTTEIINQPLVPISPAEQQQDTQTVTKTGQKVVSRQELFDLFRNLFNYKPPPANNQKKNHPQLMLTRKEFTAVLTKAIALMHVLPDLAYTAVLSSITPEQKKTQLALSKILYALAEYSNKYPHKFHNELRAKMLGYLKKVSIEYKLKIKEKNTLRNALISVFSADEHMMRRLMERAKTGSAQIADILIEYEQNCRAFNEFILNHGFIVRATIDVKMGVLYRAYSIIDTVALQLKSGVTRNVLVAERLDNTTEPDFEGFTAMGRSVIIKSKIENMAEVFLDKHFSHIPQKEKAKAREQLMIIFRFEVALHELQHTLNHEAGFVSNPFKNELIANLATILISLFPEIVIENLRDIAYTFQRDTLYRKVADTILNILGESQDINVQLGLIEQAFKKEAGELLLKRPPYPQGFKYKPNIKKNTFRKDPFQVIREECTYIRQAGSKGRIGTPSYWEQACKKHGFPITRHDEVFELAQPGLKQALRELSQHRNVKRERLAYLIESMMHTAQKPAEAIDVVRFQIMYMLEYGVDREKLPQIFNPGYWEEVSAYWGISVIKSNQVYNLVKPGIEASRKYLMLNELITIKQFTDMIENHLPKDSSNRIEQDQIISVPLSRSAGVASWPAYFRNSPNQSN